MARGGVPMERRRGGETSGHEARRRTHPCVSQLLARGLQLLACALQRVSHAAQLVVQLELQGGGIRLYLDGHTPGRRPERIERIERRWRRKGRRVRERRPLAQLLPRLPLPVARILELLPSVEEQRLHRTEVGQRDPRGRAGGHHRESTTGRSHPRRAPSWHLPSNSTRLKQHSQLSAVFTAPLSGKNSAAKEHTKALW